MKKCLLLFIITMIVSCDITDLKLSLVNNTNKTIYFHLSYDTIITNNKEYLESSNIFPAESVNPHFAWGSRGGWDDAISKGKYKRMDFKVEDLDSLEWTVVYE